MLENRKVGHSEMATLPHIIAVDFDGTLVEDRFPEIGTPNVPLFEYLRQRQRDGSKIVLWTCRANDTPAQELQAAKLFCAKHGLFFDAVNRNIDEVQAMFNHDTRKVYANEYIDDKATFHKFRPSEGVVMSCVFGK